MHLRYPQLSGLGRNPAAPEDILVRLARHPAGRHGIALQQGQLADPVVEALLTHGDHWTAVGLHGERISAAMRRRIAEHPDPAVRDAFADFVRYTVDRRCRMGIDDIEYAYGQPRAALLGHPDPKVRAAVAESWLDRPAEAQKHLLADPEPMVREAATRHEQPGVPTELVAGCLADPAVRANLARYAPLTLDQVRQLLQDGDDDIYQAVACNPHVSADAIPVLMEVPHPAVRLAVAQSRHVDADTRDRFFAQIQAEAAAGSNDASIALAWSVSEPWWLRDESLDRQLSFLDSPRPVFRRVLASCHHLPDEVWQRLDNDPDVQVRRTAASRPGTPAEVLERLVREHGDPHHIQPMLVEHPNFPRHRLRTFVDDPNPAVRYLALRDPALPADSLERLAAEPQPWMRSGVAGHPMMNEALFARLLADTDPSVVDAAAANPVLPPEWMYRILAEADL